MTLPSPQVFGPLWGISELCITLLRRSKSDSVSKDRGSLRLIWLAIGPSIALGVYFAFSLPAWRFSWAERYYAAGFGIFVLGLIVRWAAIIYLGRFFTTDVAIAAEHRLIDTGPYRWIRHPSYTGSLLSTLGFAICLGNWASLIVINVPVFIVIWWRMQVEEQALIEAFGERYRIYMQITNRLVPFVY